MTRKKAWLANLPRLQAEKRLHSDDLSNYSIDQIRRLATRATGDPSLGNKIAKEFYRAQLEAKAVGGN